MRPVALALVLSTASALLPAVRARAEGPVPIVVRPFAGRCFSATELAERVRARAGELPVTVGAPPRGSRQEVMVAERGGVLSVEVTARDGRGQIVGSARRVVPADDCATALEIAALIVARAALPLNWRETPAEPPPHPRHAPPTVTAPNQPPPQPPTPPPIATPQKPPTPAQQTKQQQQQQTKQQQTKPTQQQSEPSLPAEPIASPSVSVPSPLPPRAFPSGPGPDLRVVRGPPAREPGTVVLQVHGPNRRWVGELDAAAYGAIDLDGGSAQPGGELAIGFRRGRWGAAARGTVERDWSVSAQSAAGPLALSLRRAKVALETHVDVPVRVGAIRFAVGPELALWRVVATGLPHPHTSVVPSFSVAARVLYRLDIGRVFMQGGVTFSVAPSSEELSITGVGVVARTPRLDLGPILALGVNL